MIPNRKPATPLMELYGNGTYRKNLTSFDTSRRHNAVPGIAASHVERNGISKAEQNINIKPSLHDRFNSKFYVPDKYLNPYGNKNFSKPIMDKHESK